MQFSDTPRQSVVAGRFYSDTPQSLREEVLRYLRMRPQKLVDLKGRELLALLVPHAGYVFSGPIAGMTLGQASLPDRLIVLGPNHTGHGAPLSVWNGGPWRTPLGAMPVDEAASSALVAANVGFSGDTKAHVQEHSLEVLVPFFQIMNPNARMAAVTVSRMPLAALQKAGEALAAVVADAAASGDTILIVVSSDMSHYLPHDKSVLMDTLALDALKTLDPETYFKTIQDNGISMCGVFPMTLALFALAKLGAAKARVMAYATSGQTGRAHGADMERVVGYAGVAITR
ncbi:Memo-like family protein [uncultured delta proteobacterium]|uniref:Memo-like family protein n=1 Tax=uncultured delta proteobacterium TaxID=34034 RepID=A0A212J5V6_9DELT|nr:Memo-like family protein [uncultured delta proteobacterium]